MARELTYAGVRADIAELLFLPADQVGETDNLFDAGMDSIGLITLVERWRACGADVSFVELAETPTLASIWAVLSSTGRPGSPEEHPGDSGEPADPAGRLTDRPTDRPTVRSEFAGSDERPAAPDGPVGSGHGPVGSGEYRAGAEQPGSRGA